MKIFLCVSLICCVVLAAAVASNAQSGTMALYSDEAGTNCNLYDNGTTCPIQVYVIYKGPLSSYGQEFALEQSEGAALIYLGESIGPAMTIGLGSANTGIAVTSPTCESEPIHVLTVVYMGIGSSDICSQLRIVPDPRSWWKDEDNVRMVGCEFELITAAAGHLTINPDDDCECETNSGTVSPTIATSWGAVKSLYAQ